MMMPTDPWRTRIEGAPATLRVARAHPVHVTAAPPPARRHSAAQLAAPGAWNALLREKQRHI